MHQFNKISIALFTLLIVNNIISSKAACNCQDGMCCSKWGYCGHDIDYCGEGCLEGPCSSGGGSGGGPSGSFSGRTTYYNVHGGYTACGTLHDDHEHIAALNAPQFDPHTPNGNPNRNSLCNRRIQVNGPHGAVEVKVVDRCPSCPHGGLDLSPAAFQIVAGSLGVGVIQVSWHWK
jgi:expansin (peptidoglycan-binding protein)